MLEEEDDDDGGGCENFRRNSTSRSALVLYLIDVVDKALFEDAESDSKLNNCLRAVAMDP